MNYDQDKIYLERSNLMLDRYTVDLTYEASITLEMPSTNVKCLSDTYCFDKTNKGLYAWSDGAKVALSETNAFGDDSDYFTYQGWEVITTVDQDADKVYASVFAGSTLAEHKAEAYDFTGDIVMYSDETPAFSTINLLFFDDNTMNIIKSHFYMSEARFITVSFANSATAIGALGSNADLKSIAFGNPSIFALKAEEIVKITLLVDQGSPEAAHEGVIFIPLAETGEDVTTVTPITLSAKAQDNIAAVEDMSELFTIVSAQCICVTEGEMAMECFENGVCLFIASMTEEDCTTMETEEVEEANGTD